jgi:DNA polymerase-1
MNRLYALDGNGITHWLYHAKCEKFESTITEAIKEWWAGFVGSVGPTNAVVCWDGKKNFRYGLFAEYKSTRKSAPTDEAKIAALKEARTAWASLGLIVLCDDQFEADDMIASLCAQIASEETEVVIVATDKDLMQLVGQGVRQYDPRPNKEGVCVFYGPSEVEQKLGVPPHRVKDLLSIMGDSSDDVPGVEGWGRVAAINAIKQTKSFAELKRKALAGQLSSISEEKQCRKRSDQKAIPFSEQLDQLELSRKLVTLRTDITIDVSLEDLRIVAVAA